MKHTDIYEHVEANGLLKEVEAGAGIYAITINNCIAYIGQSKNMYQRCCAHIYHMENAQLNHDKKYELLLSAKLGGYKVDCKTLNVCKESELDQLENYYIGRAMPPLNILTPNGKQDISNLTIMGLIDILVNKTYNRTKDKKF